MKKIFFLIAIAVSAVVMAQTSPKIYLNAGHGGWGPNDRPMATHPYPMLAETGRPDTCGFYESNTNMWKVYEMNIILGKHGFQTKLSRKRNGPFPWKSGSPTETLYDRPLPEVSVEVDNYKADYFFSVHSNAAADGALENYPLFLYRGTDTQEGVTNSRKMCEQMWPFHVEAMKTGFEYMSAYNTSMNVRGDRSFYNYTWQNPYGYYGYLGVLMHGRPGYLVEGYFHTYQPSRHRALNQDWCRMEGRRYARGIIDYFKKTPETTGSIMGDVRCKSQSTSSLNYYTATGNDQYMPCNGATVRLRNANDVEIARYQVDNNYNGIFVFNNLEPGTYYVDLYCPGYSTQQGKKITNKHIVVANSTSYKNHYMLVGTAKPLDELTAIERISVDEPEGSFNSVLIDVYDMAGHHVASTTRKELESLGLPNGVYTLKGHNGKAIKYLINNK